MVGADDEVRAATAVVRRAPVTILQALASMMPQALVASAPTNRTPLTMPLLTTWPSLATKAPPLSAAAATAWAPYSMAWVPSLMPSQASDVM